MLSDGALKATNTQGGGGNLVAFGHPVFDAGRHAWNVTLGGQDNKDPGYCCIGVGDADCEGKCFGYNPQFGWFYKNEIPYLWGEHKKTPWPDQNTAALAEGARIRVVLDMDKRTLAISLNGSAAAQMQVDLPSRVRPYVVFSGNSAGATLRLSSYEGPASPSSGGLVEQQAAAQQVAAQQAAAQQAAAQQVAAQQAAAQQAAAQQLNSADCSTGECHVPHGDTHGGEEARRLPRVPVSHRARPRQLAIPHRPRLPRH